MVSQEYHARDVKQPRQHLPGETRARHTGVQFTKCSCMNVFQNEALIVLAGVIQTVFPAGAEKWKSLARGAAASLFLRPSLHPAYSGCLTSLPTECTRTELLSPHSSFLISAALQGNIWKCC
ncbi:hypothetical protein E2C01_084464 [Portunus trituberculatus]|uniref:Uncharacterized protein n=1 Tax=Portunus trituberculatus TaxID=210409 RepID=A0A5B7J4W5_PORTR|nr:hypothetical protein [Portunus trituberculatus]